MCVGMKQVEVRVIIVQCLEQDFILDKHYNTVTLISNICSVSNGVKQSGIVSPIELVPHEKHLGSVIGYQIKYMTVPIHLRVK